GLSRRGTGIVTDQRRHGESRALASQPWVADHGSDPNARPVEVDVDTSAHASGRVAGAVGWNWQIDLQRRPVRDVPTRGEWEALLGRAGIGNRTTVISTATTKTGLLRSPTGCSRSTGTTTRGWWTAAGRNGSR